MCRWALGTHRPCGCVWTVSTIWAATRSVVFHNQAPRVHAVVGDDIAELLEVEAGQSVSKRVCVLAVDLERIASTALAKISGSPKTFFAGPLRL